MNNKVEIILTADGIFRAQTTFTQLDINAGVINQISAGIIRKTPAILPGAILKNGPSRPIGLSLSGTSSAWSVELDELIINTHFATSLNGETIYPMFTEPKLPVMTIPWKVPINMRLMLMVVLGRSNELVCQYFVAFDNSSRMYILPMGNIYEEGKLCCGRYEETQSSGLDQVQTAWNQFNTSRWQSDLYHANKLSKTQSLFSFKIEKDKFVQIFPTDGSKDWTKFADKIANEAISSNVCLNPLK